jgi:RNA polymerase sigma factor (sigma-70 family)
MFLSEGREQTVKPHIPDTRNSLIVRLPDSGDAEAWEQFAAIYEPLVYRLARGKGFQDADAKEISQEVMVSVAGAVERWRPDPEKGRFRDWLFRIARNLMIKYLTRRKHRPLGTGDSQFQKLLEREGEIDPNLSRELDREYEREMFQWASAQVRQQVSEKTWNAFWLTSVEGRAIAEVARDLKMTQGAVYIARSRVIGRFNEFLNATKPAS